jgi:hypothetical protein
MINRGMPGEDWFLFSLLEGRLTPQDLKRWENEKES